MGVAEILKGKVFGGSAFSCWQGTAENIKNCE